MQIDDLDKLQANADQDSSSPKEKIRREQRSSDSSQGRLVLPMKCIFCNRVGKYSKANKTSKKLTFCQTFSADDKVRRSALEKRNVQLISLYGGVDSKRSILPQFMLLHLHYYSLPLWQRKCKKFTINPRHCVCCNENPLDKFVQKH